MRKKVVPQGQRLWRQRAFEALDKDGDNQVSIEEFVAFTTQLGEDVAVAESAFRQADKNMDAELSPREAHHSWATLLPDPVVVTPSADAAPAAEDRGLRAALLQRAWELNGATLLAVHSAQRARAAAAAVRAAQRARTSPAAPNSSTLAPNSSTLARTPAAGARGREDLGIAEKMAAATPPQPKSILTALEEERVSDRFGAKAAWNGHLQGHKHLFRNFWHPDGHTVSEIKSPGLKLPCLRCRV